MKRMLRIGLVLFVALLGSGWADTSLFGTMALAKHGNGPGNGHGWGHESMKDDGAPPWSRSNRSGGDRWRDGKSWSFGRMSVPMRRRVRRGWDKKAKHHAYGHRRWRKRKSTWRKSTWRKSTWRKSTWRRWPRKRYHWSRPIALR